MSDEIEENDGFGEADLEEGGPQVIPQAPSRAKIPGIAMAALFWVVAFVFWGQHFLNQPEPPAPEHPRYGDVSLQMQLIIQGKIIIGQSIALQHGGAVPGGAPVGLNQIELPKRDGAAARAMAALHLFLHPEDIDGALEQLDSADELEPGEPELNALVRQEIETPGTLTQPQLDELQYQMHWFTHPLILAREAADHPERGKLMVQIMCLILFLAFAALFVVAGFLAGIVLLIVAAVSHTSGRPLFKFDESRGGSRIHIWAFTAYIVVMGAPIVLTLMGIVSPLADMAGIAAFILSVFIGVAIAVLLPRGTFGERTRALGFHTGRGVIREVISGVVGYCCVLPIAAVGGIITAVLWWIMTQFQSNDTAETMAGHPIGELFFDAPAIARLGLLLLAAVAAPLIEETMFRGVLHRGLRRSFSLPLAALIGAVCFAVVHPQDIIALPVLAALGFGFTLIREWRDSLIAPMVAHGLHNGTLMTGLWIATL